MFEPTLYGKIPGMAKLMLGKFQHGSATLLDAASATSVPIEETIAGRNIRNFAPLAIVEN